MQAHIKKFQVNIKMNIYILRKEFNSNNESIEKTLQKIRMTLVKL